MPVYELLGGRQRAFVPLFATIGKPFASAWLDAGRALVAEGWDVIRFSPGAPPSDDPDLFEPREALARTADWAVKLREAVGPAPVLGIDWHHRLSVAETASFCQRMPPGTLDFLEEPIRDENPDVYAQLRMLIDVPLAIGEEFSSKWAFVPYIERGLTDFIRVDVCNVGGFTEAMKVAGWAEAYYLDLMPHNPLGPICTAATGHLCTAAPNMAWMEIRRSAGEDLGLYDRDLFPVQQLQDGPRLVVSDAPASASRWMRRRLQRRPSADPAISSSSTGATRPSRTGRTRQAGTARIHLDKTYDESPQWAALEPSWRTGRREGAVEAPRVTELLQLIFNGVVTGSILAIGAVGASLVWGVLKIGNFAHGDYMAMGAFAAYVANVWWGLNLLVAGFFAMICVALFAILADRMILRRMRGRGLTSVFIITVGIGFLIRNGLALYFGPSARQYAIDQSQVFVVGPIRMSPGQAITIVATSVAIGLVGWLLASTDIGRSMRAVSENRDLAAVTGVNTDRIETQTWLLSGGLAGLAGMTLALVQGTFDASLGVGVLFVIFTAVVLGGIGSAYGALVGGMVLGLVMEVSTWSGFLGGLDPRYKIVLAFGVLIALLLVRPQGIFGKARLL